MGDKETTSQLVATCPYSIANRNATNAIPARTPKGRATAKTKPGNPGSFPSMSNRRRKIRMAAQRKSMLLVAIGLHFFISENLLTTPIKPIKNIETNRNKYPIILSFYRKHSGGESEKNPRYIRENSAPP